MKNCQGRVSKIRQRVDTASQHLRPSETNATARQDPRNQWTLQKPCPWSHGNGSFNGFASQHRVAPRAPDWAVWLLWACTFSPPNRQSAASSVAPQSQHLHPLWNCDIQYIYICVCVCNMYIYIYIFFFSLSLSLYLSISLSLSLFSLLSSLFSLSLLSLSLSLSLRVCMYHKEKEDSTWCKKWPKSNP